MNYIIGGDISVKDCPKCGESLIWQEYGKGDISEYGLLCENYQNCEGYEIVPEEMLCRG